MSFVKSCYDKDNKRKGALHMKSIKLVAILFCFVCVFASDAITAHARILEDWEIGISKDTPQIEKEKRRASYHFYRKEAESLYIGNWYNAATGKPLSITPEYWGIQQYTYRATSFDTSNANTRIIYMELEGHKRTLYFDVSKPNEFTAYNPEYKIMSHYIRKQ